MFPYKIALTEDGTLSVVVSKTILDDFIIDSQRAFRVIDMHYHTVRFRLVFTVKCKFFDVMLTQSSCRSKNCNYLNS